MGQLIESIKYTNASNETWQDVILKELYNPIKFKNPEKINGNYDKLGYSYTITYIGRDLALEGDNYTWQINSKMNPNAISKLSVFKYQEIGIKGVDVLLKTIYSTEKKLIDRNLFNNPQWIINTLIESVEELPF